MGEGSREHAVYAAIATTQIGSSEEWNGHVIKRGHGYLGHKKRSFLSKKLRMCFFGF